MTTIVASDRARDLEPFCRFSSGAGHPHPFGALQNSHVLSLFWIVSLRHGQHSMILVPMETPGVKLIRPLTVFGQDGEVTFPDYPSPDHHHI